MVTDYLQEHAAELVVGKNVLELGAGAGLPGIVCGRLGAERVRLDYMEGVGGNADGSGSDHRLPRPRPDRKHIIQH